MHFNVLMCVNPPSIISLILKYGNNPASASTIGLHIWSTHTHWKRFLSNSCIFSQPSKAYPSVKHLNRALSIYLPICSMWQSNIFQQNPTYILLCFPSLMTSEHLVNTTSWTVWLANFIQVTLSCVNKTLSYVQHRAKHKKALLRSELEYLTQVNQHKV